MMSVTQPSTGPSAPFVDKNLSHPVLRPKISILLPNYNHGPLLEFCVQALFDQTYKNWELIIIDDGSSDDSHMIINRLAGADSRVRPLLFQTNTGVIAATRSGFDHASGDLFFGIAADDFLVDPTFFESAVDALSARPKAAGVFGRCSVVDADDLRELWTMGSAPAEGFNSAEASLTGFFAQTMFIPGASAIWRMPLVRAAGLFDARLGPQADYFLNHALPAIAQGVVFLDRVVAAVRASPASYSASASDDDFLRRHALIEAKLRELPSIHVVPEQLLRQWRFGVINARLTVTHQRNFFQMVNETHSNVPPYHRDNIPAEFVALIESLVKRCASMSDALERRVQAAEAIFNDVVLSTSGSSA